jgi:hypothetical protein
MWIRTDDRGWYHDPICGDLWIGIYYVIMISWPNLKCDVEWKGCDRELSRQIWGTMLIITDDIGWCHDLFWGALWIGTDVMVCCLDIIWIAMWIRKNVTGIFHDQFDVLCELIRWYKMMSSPNLRWYMDRNRW